MFVMTLKSDVYVSAHAYLCTWDATSKSGNTEELGACIFYTRDANSMYLRMHILYSHNHVSDQHRRKPKKKHIIGASVRFYLIG
jgi:hypothetical protein